MLSVILTRPKYPHNLAAAIRACACFGVDQLLYTGNRFEFKDGERLPREERMKGYASVKWQQTERPFDALEPRTRVVGVELTPTAYPLNLVDWNQRLGSLPYSTAIVFGPEDGHIHQSFRTHCWEFVYIPARHCLNLAAAINVVLAHRTMQISSHFKPADSENRGIIESVPGWDGK